jgi:hypothetical protein
VNLAGILAALKAGDALEHAQKARRFLSLLLWIATVCRTRQSLWAFG